MYIIILCVCVLLVRSQNDCVLKIYYTLKNDKCVIIVV